MKTPLIILILALCVSACASVRSYHYSTKTFGEQHQAFIGEEVYRIHKERDLPNAFGKADPWGERINEGISELRFIGFTDEGEIIFILTNVEIISNETVVSRYESHSTTITEDGRSFTISTPASTPDVTEIPSRSRITFNPAQTTLKLRDVSVEITDVQDNSISYILHENQESSVNDQTP